MSEVPLSQMPVAPTKWHHLPTTVYPSNYGFGINYYQPMIEYLDRKEGGEVSSAVALKAALPWTEARASWEHKRVEPYTREELAKHAVGAEIRAKEHLENFKVGRPREEDIGQEPELRPDLNRAAARRSSSVLGSLKSLGR
jgi:hypothetical protein